MLFLQPFLAPLTLRGIVRSQAKDDLEEAEEKMKRLQLEEEEIKTKEEEDNRVVKRIFIYL